MNRIYVSSVIDAPAAAVWARVRDFNGMPGWHPGIAASRIEDDWPSDRIGCVRELRIGTDGRVRERLLTLCDYEYQFRYCILDATLPLRNYVAGLRLMPVTDGDRTFAEWTAEFDTDPGREAEMTETVGQGVFQRGFDALKEHFGKR